MSGYKADVTRVLSSTAHGSAIVSSDFGGLGECESSISVDQVFAMHPSLQVCGNVSVCT